MNITLTVRGTLEDDLALQEIVSILYRKTVPAAGVEVVTGVEESRTEDDMPNTYVPVPKSGTAALSADLADESQTEDKPAPKPAPAPSAAPEVEFETVRKAASDAMNSGKRDEVGRILKAHGGKLTNMPPSEWSAVLAEIEAL